MFVETFGIASRIPKHFKKRPGGKSKSLLATSQVSNFLFSTRSATKLKFLLAEYLLKIGCF